ncbi:TPM domain-containing protein [Allomuricauda sp. R78024]|uniref:TPM domain-containing protein n=1 Tax=Allomuricauda sp. R78024 TaxID=3093867 RepID=UPI0037C5434E
MVKRVLFYFLLLVSFFGFAQQQYPDLKEIVTDSAKIFTVQELEGLKTKLTNFEEETTNQLVVLTIKELGFETIEEYANKTFNKNKLGQKEKDNGILILFAHNDRKVRIEVGYGLEPYITDAVASNIIRNTMIPQFKESNYYEGINLAADQLIEFLNNPEALEEFKKEMDANENQMDWVVKLVMALFLSIFIAAGGFIFFKAYSGLIEIFRGMLIGKLGLLQGLFMMVFSLIQILFSSVFILMPLFFASMVFGVVKDIDNMDQVFEHTHWLYYILASFLGITILIAVLKILLKGKEDFKLSLYKNDKTYMRKTFSSSGSHSFGSSSGGSSSGGFSGGGGSSGGGGASGSW